MRDRVVTKLLVVVAGAVAALMLFFTTNGLLNADEGFYLFASSAVRHGLHPYRDFGFTQGPILPYANIPWLELFGYTLSGQRLSSCAWAVVTLVVAALWLRRNSTSWTALVFLILILGVPSWVAMVVKGKTYAFGGLCVLAAVWTLLSKRPIWMRWAVFLVAAGLGVGARFPLAGYFLPAGIGLLSMTHTRGTRLWVIAVVATCAAVELNWAAGGRWDRFFYWAVRFHQESSFHFSVTQRFGWAALYSVPLWLLFGFGFWSAFKNLETARILAFASLAIGTIVNVSARSAYAEYIIPFIPAIALLVAADLNRLGLKCGISRESILLIFCGASGWIMPPELSRDILVHAREAQLFLEENLPEDSVVAGSMPEIAVAAKMQVAPMNAMGKFGLTEDYSEELAAERLLCSPQALTALIEDGRTEAVVLSPYSIWNFYWSVPSYKMVTLKGQNQIRQAINKEYHIGLMNDDYLIFIRKRLGAESQRQPSLLNSDPKLPAN